MNDDLAQLLDEAKSQKKDNKKLISKLKRQNSKTLDRQFHQAHEEAFNKIDCLDCANCCKTTSPIFRDKDITRLASHLSLKPAEFEAKYLMRDTDGLMMLKSAPCPFLLSDNKCSVYNYRPKACREYPHTDRKDMYQLLDITYRNTLVCPAVHFIVKKIRKDLQ
jgi:uncharacterized protein